MSARTTIGHMLTRYRSMLVWGGPNHGEVIEADASYNELRIPLSSNAPVTRYITEEMRLRQEVTYRVQRFAFRDETWLVLVYAENFEGHCTRLVKLMDGIAALCTWQWAL